ncbi:DNA-binding MarR family transcriptional regulator [Rhodococcus sp. 27YEA15]|uniref:MarR family winged helix-turn-helix transcriptional regulator n=1 Tax=Rhodococcus sp. 27YEA15 TaxID=3156259 RepID=UPI003C7B7A85
MSDSAFTAPEDRLWRALMHVNALLPSVLEGDLQRAFRISLSQFAALLHLSEAEGGRMRMSELASAATLSPSRITRVIAELQRSGLVEKVTSTEDGRGMVAVITEAGRELAALGYPVQVARARALFLEHLDESEIDHMGSVLEAVAARASNPAPLAHVDGNSGTRSTLMPRAPLTW